MKKQTIEQQIDKHRLIDNIINIILDNLQKTIEMPTTLESISSKFKGVEPILKINEISEKNNAIAQNIINYIINKLKLKQKSNENELSKEFCTTIFDDILQRMSLCKVWPNLYHNHSDNIYCTPIDINLNSIFTPYEISHTNFFKLKLKEKKKNRHVKKNTCKEDHLQICFPIINKIPEMKKPKHIICEPIPKLTIIVDVDEFSYNDHFNAQLNSLFNNKKKETEVVLMTYRLEKESQTVFKCPFMTVETQTQIEVKPQLCKSEAKMRITKYCRLLINSLLLVIDEKKIKSNLTFYKIQPSISTQLSVHLFFLNDLLSTNIENLVDILLYHCTDYKKMLSTCSCKISVQKHSLFSSILNIFLILTKLLALINLYQFKNKFPFVFRLEFEAIYLRSCFFLLSVTDNNKITSSDIKILKPQDLKNILKFFNIFILNINHLVLFQENNDLRKFIFKRLKQFINEKF